MALGITDLFSTVSAIALSLLGDAGTVSEKQMVPIEHADSSIRAEVSGSEPGAKRQDTKDLPTLKGSGGGEGSIASPKAKPVTSKGIDLPSRGSGSTDETQGSAENQVSQVSPSSSSGNQVSPRKSLPQDFIEPSQDEVGSSSRSHVPSPQIQDSASPSSEGASLRSPQASGHTGEGASDEPRSSGGGGSGSSSLESRGAKSGQTLFDTLQAENKSLRTQVSSLLSGIPSADQTKKEGTQQQAEKGKSVPYTRTISDSRAPFEKITEGEVEKPSMLKTEKVQSLPNDTESSKSEGPASQKIDLKKASPFIASRPVAPKAKVEESPVNVSKNNLSSSPTVHSLPLPAKFIGGTISPSHSPVLSQVQDATISKEIVEAARALGFDLNAPYKDAAEAIRVLAQKVSGKNTARDNELERIFDKIDNGSLKFEDQQEIIQRLNQEGDELGVHQKLLTGFLNKKYTPTQKKKIQTGPGTGNAEQDLFNAIKGISASAVEATPEELERELETLKQQVRALNEQEEMLYASDKPRDAKAVKGEKEAVQEKIIEKRNLLVKLTAKKKMPEDTSHSMARGVLNQAQQEKQERAVSEYKVSHPELTPFMELLTRKDQANFLKAKVKVVYDENGGRPTNLLSKNNKTREVPVDYLLSRLTEEQRATLLKGIESRTDDDSGSESNIRLSALRYFPVYQALDKFEFPVWTEELARLAAPAARGATVKTVKETSPLPSVLTVDPEIEITPIEDVSSDSGHPKGVSTEPVREREELKGKNVGNKINQLHDLFGKGPSEKVLRSRGLPTKKSAEED